MSSWSRDVLAEEPLESEALGRNTKCERAVNHFRLGAGAMEIRYPATSDERPRILVVEPNRTNLGVMARRLAEHGYRVTTADNGASAIAELYRLPIDLVLAELNMPRMSGADLARAIRGEVQWNDIPIMLITGKSEPKGAVRAYEAGADDVILKPFHFEVLIARIEWARSVKRLREDNATLDARVVERAIQIGELREELRAVRAKARSIIPALGRHPPSFLPFNKN
jgi:DNA-binding response OmpR family regulator